MKSLFFAVVALAATAALAPNALAVNVRNCDETASVQTLAEPWERNTRAFYKGEVRVALLDTGGEPVCCSTHLLILVPDKSSEMGDRTCHIVSDHASMGFSGIDFAHLTAKYQEGKGLLLTFPYTLYVDGLSMDRGTVTKE